MILALYITITVLFLFWVAMPLLGQATTSRAHDELTRERIKALLDSLKELRAGRQSERLAEDDVANIERRLMLELARIYHHQGINPSIPEELTETPADSEVENCNQCGREREQRYRYCPFCGSQAAA